MDTDATTPGCDGGGHIAGAADPAPKRAPQGPARPGAAAAAPTRQVARRAAACAPVGALACALACALPRPAAAEPLDPVPCLIEPSAVVKLSTPVPGVVVDVRVERGQWVETGDVLARLDARLEEVALREAQRQAENLSEIAALSEKVAFLEQQHDRKLRLVERRAVSETEADEARVEVVLARNDLENAKLRRDLAALSVEKTEVSIDQRALRTTISGLVTERLVSAGEYQDGRSHFATVVRLDELRVEAYAPIGYWSALSVGQTVFIRPEAPVGGIYPADITVIDRVFDAATGTFGLRMALPNPDLSLPAGLRCEVFFDEGSARAAR